MLTVSHSADVAWPVNSSIFCFLFPISSSWLIPREWAWGSGRYEVKRRYVQELIQPELEKPTCYCNQILFQFDNDARIMPVSGTVLRIKVSQCRLCPTIWPTGTGIGDSHRSKGWWCMALTRCELNWQEEAAFCNLIPFITSCIGVREHWRIWWEVLLSLLQRLKFLFRHNKYWVTTNDRERLRMHLKFAREF